MRGRAVWGLEEEVGGAFVVFVFASGALGAAADEDAMWAV